MTYQDDAAEAAPGVVGQSPPADNPLAYNSLQDRPPMGEPPAPLVESASALDSLRFKPEPPWGRWMGVAIVVMVAAAAGIFSVVGSVLGVVIDVVSGNTSDFDFATFEAGLEVEDMIASLPATVVLGTLFQQLGQGLSPWLFSKVFDGYGYSKDWGLKFKWIDIPIGFGLAAAGFGLAQLVAFLLAPLVGVDDLAEADNGVIVSGFKGSVWLYPMLVAVVIGAPFSEEIAFRGVVQRAASRFGGPLVGIVGSSLAFAVVHIGGESFGGQIVLWASIFMIGLVFAVANAYFKRLGPCIVGHIITNLGAAIALLA